MSAPEGDGVLRLADRPHSGVRWSIDWLEVSVKVASRSLFVEKLRKNLGEPFGRECWQWTGSKDQRCQARGIYKAVLQADAVGSKNKAGEHEPWVSVRLPGQCCRAVGTDALLALLVDLRWLPGMKVSRLDIAIDDFDRRVLPRQVGAAAIDGALDDEQARLAACVVTRVRRLNWNWDRRKGGCLWLGRGGSDRSLRIYDKAQESEGLIPSVRFELQLRNRHATKWAEMLLSAREQGESMPAVVGSAFVSFVDLREPKSDRSRSRDWPRAAWWESIVGDVRRWSLGAPERSSVGHWIGAMAIQCRPFVEVLMRSHGSTLDEVWRAFSSGRLSSQAVEAMVRTLLQVRGERPVTLSPVHEGRLQEVVSDRERVGSEADVSPPLVALARKAKRDRFEAEWREVVLGRLDPSDQD